VNAASVGANKHIFRNNKANYTQWQLRHTRQLSVESSYPVRTTLAKENVSAAD